jgi:hypothetical protein
MKTYKAFVQEGMAEYNKGRMKELKAKLKDVKPNQGGTYEERLKFFMKQFPKWLHTGNGLQWTKSRGHLPKFASDWQQTLWKKLGFKTFKTKSTGSPDGSYVGGDNKYKDKYGNIFSSSTSYGVVAADNYFSMSISFPVETDDREIKRL